MKKLMALLLTTVMVVSMLAGCSSSSSSSSDDTTASADAEETTDSGLYDKVVVALAADPADLTPYKPNGTGRSNFFWSIYETLFDFDDDNNLVPNLAMSYTEVSDTEWEIEIYHNIYDSDGNNITAEDVVFSVNWLVDSGNNIKYTLFDSIEVVDDYTVLYTWTEKPESVTDLEWPLCRTFIFSETAWNEHNFATDPVATGSFVVESFTAGSSLVLTANENYWADNTDEDVSMRLAYHTATVETVEYQVISESVSAVLALQMGTVDLCDYVPLTSLSDFEEGGDYADQYTVETTISTDYYYMLPNFCSDTIGDDLNLRLAIYYALNSDTIATAMGGSYLTLTTLGDIAFDDYDEAWEEDETYVNTYDLELAQEYLAASDYNGEEIVIVSLSSEECENAMTMIQSLLIDGLGLNVKIEQYEKAYFQTIVAESTGWDFQITSTGGTTLIGSFSALFSHEENNGYTNAWLQDETLEELYTTACADATHDSEHMKELIDYAFSIGYVYPLTALSSSLVYSNIISEICYREGYWTIGASTFN